jgi:putative flippase GtrA
MRKLDAILASLIGFFNGLFFWFLLWRAKKILPFNLPYWILIIFLPFSAIFGLFIASLIGKKVFTLFQAAKFFLVGTLNTFIDLGIVSLLIWVTEIVKGGLYALFKAISFLVATTNSYFWNKFWTFEKKEKAKPEEFFKFLVITAIGLGINVGIASFFVNIIGPKFGLTPEIWSGAIAPIIAAFFAFVWNFLSSKFIVFKK